MELCLQFKDCCTTCVLFFVNDKYLPFRNELLLEPPATSWVCLRKIRWFYKCLPLSICSSFLKEFNIPFSLIGWPSNTLVSPRAFALVSFSNECGTYPNSGLVRPLFPPVSNGGLSPSMKLEKKSYSVGSEVFKSWWWLSVVY